MGETWEQGAESSGKARIWKVRSVGIYICMARGRKVQKSQGVTRLTNYLTLLGHCSRSGGKEGFHICSDCHMSKESVIVEAVLARPHSE